MSLWLRVSPFWIMCLLVAGLAGFARAGADDYDVTWLPEVHSPGNTSESGEDPLGTWSWSWTKSEDATYDESWNGRYWDRVTCNAGIEIAASAHMGSSSPPNLSANSWASFEETWVWNGPPGVEPNRMTVDYRFTYLPEYEKPSAYGEGQVLGNAELGSAATGSADAEGWGGSSLELETADPSYRYSWPLRVSGSGRAVGTLFSFPPYTWQIASAWVSPSLEGDTVSVTEDPDFVPWGNWGMLARGYAETDDYGHNGDFSTAKPTYVMICTTSAGCGAKDKLYLSAPGYAGGYYSGAYARASAGAILESSVVVQVLDD